MKAFLILTGSSDSKDKARYLKNVYLVRFKNENKHLKELLQDSKTNNLKFLFLAESLRIQEVLAC